MNFKLALIRHGKTEANEKKLYCGSADIPLSRLGRKELQRKIKDNIYPEADGYYTSGMLRCNETLKLIYGRDKEFKVIEGLREIRLGVFEMKSFEELKTNRDYLLWINDKTGDFKCPKGESKNIFYNRVGMAILSLCSNIDKSGYESPVCIAHGGVIACIMEKVFGNRKNFYDWQPAPGEGYTLFHGESGFYDYLKIKSN